jgi:hypothetical protein
MMEMKACSADEAKLLKDQNDEIKILKDSAYKRIKKLLVGKETAAKLVDDKGKVLLNKGQEIAETSLDEIPEKYQGNVKKGLDLKVEKGVLVSGVEARGDLIDDLRGSIERESGILQHPLEAGSGQVLHDDVHVAAFGFLADIVDADYVRMVDAACALGFPPESLTGYVDLLRGQPLGRVENLDGHGAMNEGVLGPIDDSHPA